MSSTEVSIRPFADGPYPLVPNEDPWIEHEFFECGDPDSCLHDKPLDTPFYELRDVPFAETPRVFRTDDYEVVEDAESILEDLGIPRRYRKGFAIVFHDSLKERDAAGSHTTGYFDGLGYFDTSDKECSILYPLAVHVLSGRPERETNATILHEIGHGIKYLENDEIMRESLYSKASNLKRTSRLGAAAIMLGLGLEVAAFTERFHPAAAFPGTIVLGLGALAVYSPKLVLWHLDSEERYCERFALQHQDIKLIRPKD